MPENPDRADEPEAALGLPPGAFARLDESDDTLFYEPPRLVQHIDDGAIAALTELYRVALPPGGALLDLMSSWVSHLPPEIEYGEIVGHGMNAEELAANPRLARWFVQDLNKEPKLPLPEAAFDAAMICVSIQYLQRPVTVLREVRRVLRPGAPIVVGFSNRCFWTKASATRCSPSSPAPLNNPPLWIIRLPAKAGTHASASGMLKIGPGFRRNAGRADREKAGETGWPMQSVGPGAGRDPFFGCSCGCRMDPWPAPGSVLRKLKRQGLLTGARRNPQSA
jgi:methyltransferase family protein